MVRRVATANDASDEARVSSSDEVELGEDASAEVEGIKRDRGVIDSYTWCGLDGGKLRLEPVKDHNTEAPAIDVKVCACRLSSNVAFKCVRDGQDSKRRRSATTDGGAIEKQCQPVIQDQSNRYYSPSSRNRFSRLF